MKPPFLMAAGICAAGMIMCLQQSVSAQTVTYGTTVTTINGFGNPNTDWSLYNNTTLNLALGFKAQYNYPSYPGNDISATPSPNNGSGTFYFNAGYKPGSATRSTWNFWFSLNANPNGVTGPGAPTLATSGYDFYFTVLAPGALTPTTPFNLLTLPDNSYGNNSTANGGGTVGTAGTYAGTYSIAQNSENLSFGFLPGFNPMLAGDYQFDVFAVTAGADASSAPHVGEITGIVSVQAVPEPSTMALAGFGGLLVWRGIRRRSH